MLTLSERKELGRRLKDARKDQKLTQEQAVKKIGGITIQMLSGWETGNSVPQLDNLIKLSNFYNLSLDYIIAGKKKDDKDLNVYTYKDAIIYTIILIESGLFYSNLYKSNGYILNEIKLFTTNETLVKFANEFQKLNDAKESMKKELYEQAIRDLINKYDIHLKA